MIVEEGHFPGNRSIEVSCLNIVRTYSAVGSNCPVVTGDLFL
ncbi:hypothetical protein [cyanobacterium endosymbiont of Rhopalodia gibberula]|nr:hypothetical protein [cyanobacterium endosymbiont of Rhopalodia gibberula]